MRLDLCSSGSVRMDPRALFLQPHLSTYHETACSKESVIKDDPDFWLLQTQPDHFKLTVQMGLV